MHPITTKPFMLVMLAVTTREFKPETGELILRVGVAKNWMSSVFIWINVGKLWKFEVDVMTVVDVELNVKEDLTLAFVVSIGIV